MAEMIATYADGSGTYQIFRDADKLTTKILDGDEVMETFEMTLTRDASFDNDDWSDWQLTEEFASHGDELRVLINGEAFVTEFI